jgi:hypothetical protein
MIPAPLAWLTRSRAFARRAGGFAPSASAHMIGRASVRRTAQNSSAWIKASATVRSGEPAGACQ